MSAVVVEEDALPAPDTTATDSIKRERELEDAPNGDGEAPAAAAADHDGEGGDAKRAKITVGNEENIENNGDEAAAADPASAVKVVLIEVLPNVAKRIEDTGLDAMEKSSGATISLRDSPLGTAKQVSQIEKEKESGQADMALLFVVWSVYIYIYI